MNTGRVGWILVGLIAGLLLAVPAASTSSTSATGSEATGPALIRVTNRELSLKRVDVGLPGRGPGDMEIIRQALYNPSVTSRSIGHAELLCTFVDRQARNCRATYFLPKGRLVVAGSLRFRMFYVLAVIGGTGLYNNARGTLTVTRTGSRPTRDLVLFRLAG